MSPEQMLPGQMSPWQLESVLDVPRSLPLRFRQNWVSNRWDIGDVEFLWVGGWFAKSFSCLTQLKVMLGWVELWLSWGFNNSGHYVIDTQPPDGDWLQWCRSCQFICVKGKVLDQAKNPILIYLIPKVLICFYLIVVLLLLVTNYTAGRWGSPQSR